MPTLLCQFSAAAQIGMQNVGAHDRKPNVEHGIAMEKEKTNTPTSEEDCIAECQMHIGSSFFFTLPQLLTSYIFFRLVPRSINLVLLLTRVTAQPQQIRPTVMATDIDEAPRHDCHARVNIRNHQTFSFRFKRLREHSAIGSNDGREAASRRVHEHALAGGHQIDTLLS